MGVSTHESATERGKVKEKKEEKDGAVTGVSREKLCDLLNEDLAREYQAVIAYVVYSQVLKGAEYMNIAGELEKHAGEELQHALIISNLVDYLGGMPVTAPKTVRTSDKAKDMLQFDLENEGETADGKLRGRYRVSRSRPSFNNRLTYFGLERAWNAALEDAER